MSGAVTEREAGECETDRQRGRQREGRDRNRDRQTDGQRQTDRRTEKERGVHTQHNNTTHHATSVREALCVPAMTAIGASWCVSWISTAPLLAIAYTIR